MGLALPRLSAPRLSLPSARRASNLILIATLLGSLVVLGTLVYLMLSTLSRLTAQTERIVEQNLDASVEAANIATKVQDVNADLYALMTAQAAGQRIVNVQAELAQIRAEVDRIIVDLTRYRDRHAGDRHQGQIVDALDELNNYKVAMDWVGSMLELDFASTVAFIEPFDEIFNRLEILLNDLAATAVREARGRSEGTAQHARQTITAFVLVVAGAAVAATLSSFWFGRFHQRLQTTTEVLEREVLERTAELRATAETLADNNQRLAVANRQIMDSIQYARRIQYALLPSQNVLRNVTADHFLIFQPRDVVGGDYYWVESIGDRYLVMVVDCTGHGVPGACMTMIVATMLDRVLHERGHQDPARILLAVGTLVRRALRQDHPAALSDDGFDAGICLVDPPQRTLTFAGARLPLFIAEDGVVREIKGDRRSLGYKSSSSTKAFTKHQIALRRGMCFYLMTDGLTDQVGGPERRMFGKRQLKTLLSRHAAKPLAEQEIWLMEALDHYQGNEVRRDDVTAIGFAPL